MRALAAIFLAAAFSIPGFSQETNSPGHPATWAVKLDRPGLPNLFQVTTNLYRGAQPTTEGTRQLKAMGVKTIINLRTFHSDREKITGTALAGEHLKMEPWHVNEADVVRFLQIVSQTTNLPAFVHCARGADRTGTMCAMYRIVCCGWTKQEAIRELKEGGFGFNPAWQNLVNYIEHADIAELKHKIEHGTQNQKTAKEDGNTASF